MSYRKKVQTMQTQGLLSGQSDRARILGRLLQDRYQTQLQPFHVALADGTRLDPVILASWYHDASFDGTTLTVRDAFTAKFVWHNHRYELETSLRGLKGVRERSKWQPAQKSHQEAATDEFECFS